MHTIVWHMHTYDCNSQFCNGTGYVAKLLLSVLDYYYYYYYCYYYYELQLVSLILQLYYGLLLLLLLLIISITNSNNIIFFTIVNCTIPSYFGQVVSCAR